MMKSKPIVKVIYKSGLYIIAKAPSREIYRQLNVTFDMVVRSFPLNKYDIKVVGDDDGEYDFLLEKEFDKVLPL